MTHTIETGSASNLSLQYRPRDTTPWTVALSLAANRASKIRLLRADDTAHCDEIADRYERSLRADVEAFLAKHDGRHPPCFRVALYREAGLA